MKSLNPEMTQLLYEVLTNSSVRDYSGYEDVRPLSTKVKVDGDIVYFLEELLDGAEKHLELDPAEVLADVVDRGIVSWCLALEQPERDKLGLEDLAQLDDIQLDAEPCACADEKSRGSVTAEELEEKKEQQLSAIENLERIRKRIARQLEEERAKSAKLENDVAQMKENLARAEDDAQPADLPAYDAYFSPYTQLTSHVFAPDVVDGQMGAKPKPMRKENSRRRDTGNQGNGSGRTRRFR